MTPPRPRRVLVVGAAALAAAVAALPGPAQAAEGFQVTRLFGVDRYAAAATVAVETWGTSESVVLASGQDTPDALAAAALAGSLADGVPVLLTTATRTPDVTVTALDRLGVRSVTVVGGPGAVSDGQLQSLREAGYTVTRIGGADRFVTAANVALRLQPERPRQAFLANGVRYADAVAAGPVANGAGIPLLLTESDRVPTAAVDALQRLGVQEVLVLGGERTISPAVDDELRELGFAVRRVAGDDRAGTAVRVAELAWAEHGFDRTRVGVVSGSAFADASTAAGVAGRERYPVLLSASPTALGEVTSAALRAAAGPLLGGVAVGGPAVLGPEVLEQVRVAVLGDPAPPLAAVGEPQVVAGGLATPWGLAVLPDGAVLVSERDTALVKRIGTDGAVATLGRVPGVVPQGEGGLLGLAASPSYAVDRLVFAYVTTATDNRVVSFVDDGGELGPLRAVVTGIPRGTIHNGGRLASGPGGVLYVGTGDAGVPGRAQDPASLGGKVLRVTPDGLVPGDNPVLGSPVFTRGHRNVQGLAFDAVGRLYASELGQNRLDEVNLLRPGMDYGWPLLEGPGGDPRYVDPLVTWAPADASPSGAAVAGGALYVAALRGERLWQVPLAGEGRLGEPRALFAGRFGRLRAVAVDRDGHLLVLTNEGTASRLLRVPLL